MKSLFAAAVLGLAALVLPAAAQAQVAAGNVPDPFSQPAAGTPTPAPAAAPAPVSSPANAASEEVLRTIIAEARTGTLNYDLFTPDLGDRVKAQESQLLPLIQGFGQVQAVDFVGSQNGADLFVVVFANAQTQWVIGFEGDKVAALLFRPAE
ncbi:hypothetical protein [Brevundimonas sp. FT23042]|uniref:hypothetical protein n=1 Tax=Brevundimonas sp. FT23042 TaxID=3393749 RepID=UPI003B5874E2